MKKPLRKVVKIQSKGQLDLYLLLECGHVVMHAIPYSSSKSIKQLTPKKKRCSDCKELQ